MQIGLGVLGLTPIAFWSLTPRELQAALRGRLGFVAENLAFSRNDLDALMQRFPDEKR
jgi:uncharacterized phage protein (TIGR02216 family)